MTTSDDYYRDLPSKGTVYVGSTTLIEEEYNV